MNIVQIICEFNVTWRMNGLKVYTEISLMKVEVRENDLEGRCDISDGPASVITISDSVSLGNICFKVNFNVVSKQ